MFSVGKRSTTARPYSLTVRQARSAAIVDRTRVVRGPCRPDRLLLSNLLADIALSRDAERGTVSSSAMKRQKLWLRMYLRRTAPMARFHLGLAGVFAAPFVQFRPVRSSSAEVYYPPGHAVWSHLLLGCCTHCCRGARPNQIRVQSARCSRWIGFQAAVEALGLMQFLEIWMSEGARTLRTSGRSADSTAFG